MIVPLIQTGGAAADALPLLSVGAFVAILNAAVTFGIVKGKTDGMENFKQEVRDSFTAVNKRIDEMNADLSEIQRALGRLEGPSRRNTDSGGGR